MADIFDNLNTVNINMQGKDGNILIFSYVKNIKQAIVYVKTEAIEEIFEKYLQLL